MAVYQIKDYKNTGLQYIEGSKIMFCQKGSNNGVIITKKEFADWDADGTLFARLLSVKAESNLSGWNFKYAAEHGKIRANDGSSRKPNQIDEEPLIAEVPMVNRMRAEDYTDEEVNKIIDVPFLPQEYRSQVPGKDDMPGRRALLQKLLLDNMQDVSSEPHKASGKSKKESVVGIHNSLVVIIIIMLLVGVGSLVMSGYHITRYLWEARGPVVATTTGVIMALYAAFAFTTGRIFWFMGKKNGFTFTKKSGKKVVLPSLKDGTIAFAFWITALAVVVYAMSSTMNVNNDDFRAAQKAKVEVAVAKDTTVKVVNQKDIDTRAEAARLDSIIAKADAEQAPWTKEINRYTQMLSAPNLTDEQIASIKQSRSNAQYNFNVIENRVKADRAARSKIAGQLTGTSDDAIAAETKIKEAEEKGTLFSLLHDIFGWDIDLMKLILYVLPAIFYDIMAPFALTVVLILEERREEDNDELSAK